VSENGQQQARTVMYTKSVILDADACYRALVARDERYDGTFFVGVKTTGIYCRPVCRARTPRSDRCLFFRRAVEAESHGFRACFRCRPERAPGNAPVDALSRAVVLAMMKIEAGALNNGSVEDLAAELGITSRHLRRAMQAELGVSPLDFALSRRIALARELLLGTSMSITEVAFASGFSSLRRFNAAFLAHQGKSPSAMRRAQPARTETAATRLTLDYRPPHDWDALITFLRARAVPGVESADASSYRRTVELGAHRGWISVSPAKGRHALYVDVSPSLTSVLMAVAARVRRLFDLDAHPSIISAQLGQDPKLGPLVQKRPGLRLPGAFNPFETSVRAVLGQQVSVAAATTLAGRLAERLGDRIETPFEALSKTFPTPERIVGTDEQALMSLGITGARARTIKALAEVVTKGTTTLDATSEPEATMAALLELPGVGPWTAQYVAMRALSFPDAFPDGDLGIRKGLGGVSAAACLQMAEAWRPWRAYAAMHIWTNL